MKSSHGTTKYAQVALKAALMAAEGTHPLKAWQVAAADVFSGCPAAEKKSCPKSAFLGLAEAGLIKGVVSGQYTKSIENKRYAESAVLLLQEKETWSEKPEDLWSHVAETAGKKKHNGQMHVVLALWNAKKLAGQST